MKPHTLKGNTMFKLSLPVQRFVIGCILVMIIIIIGNAFLNDLWAWQSITLDTIYQSPS